MSIGACHVYEGVTHFSFHSSFILHFEIIIFSYYVIAHEFYSYDADIASFLVATLLDIIR